MTQTELIDITREAILLTMRIGAPVMIIGLIVGVLIALIQALTQIQEMTLVFVPKILVIFFSIFLLFPAFVTVMGDFMKLIADQIVSGGVG